MNTFGYVGPDHSKTCHAVSLAQSAPAVSSEFHRLADMHCSREFGGPLAAFDGKVYAFSGGCHCGTLSSRLFTFQLLSGTPHSFWLVHN